MKVKMVWSGRGYSDDGVDNFDGKYGSGNVTFANNSQIEHFLYPTVMLLLACLFPYSIWYACIYEQHQQQQQPLKTM